MNSLCISLAVFCFSFAVTCAVKNGWQPWTECTKPCGEGTQKSTKYCDGHLCFRKEASCNVFACDDPLLSATWSECSARCGGGERSCKGTKNQQLQTIPCNTQPCTSGRSVRRCAASVVFVVDKTGSVGLKNWALSKQFVADVIKGLPVARGRAKVGVISYSTKATVEVVLGGSRNVDSIVGDVFAMPYDGSAANTYYAMKKMRHVLENVSGKSVAVIITDGASVTAGIGDSAAIDEAKEAKEAGVKILGIDINNDNQELAAIVSDSEDTLSVDSYSNLHTLVADILDKICE